MVAQTVEDLRSAVSACACIFGGVLPRTSTIIFRNHLLGRHRVVCPLCKNSRMIVVSPSRKFHVLCVVGVFLTFERRK